VDKKRTNKKGQYAIWENDETKTQRNKQMQKNKEHVIIRRGEYINKWKRTNKELTKYYKGHIKNI
jgi:hypothetical protein